MTTFHTPHLLLVSILCLFKINSMVESVERNLGAQIVQGHSDVMYMKSYDPPRVEHVDFYKSNSGSSRKRRARRHKLKKLAKSLDETCGRKSLISYIAGGRDAKLGEFPSYVYTLSLKPKKNSKEHAVLRCGGAILSPYHILTAAHCVEQGSAIYVKPTLYRQEPSDIKSMVQVDKVCLSGAWRPDAPLKSTDLAVYRLKQPLKFGKNVQSACLPQRQPEGNAKAYMIGLGVNKENTKNKGILQVLRVKQSLCPVGAPADRVCYRSSRRFVENYGSMCHGDSGGPLLGKQDGKATVFGVNHAAQAKCDAVATSPAIVMSTYIHRNEILQLIQCTNK